MEGYDERARLYTGLDCEDKYDFMPEVHVLFEEGGNTDSETDDEIRVEFHVVHKFGTSMIFSSMTVMDYLEENIRSIKLGKPVRAVMKIIAIKARKTHKVDHEKTRIIK
jgi:hypothetical protein